MDRSVFISYSHTDRAAVRRDAELLRASGVQVFIDVRDIAYGERWRDVLQQALMQCERVLVFWSRSALGSAWVDREWRFALSLGKKIVPTLLDPTPLPTELADFHAVTRYRRAPRPATAAASAVRRPAAAAGARPPPRVAAGPRPRVAAVPAKAAAGSRSVALAGGAVLLLGAGAGAWWLQSPPQDAPPAVASTPHAAVAPVPSPAPPPKAASPTPYPPSATVKPALPPVPVSPAPTPIADPPTPTPAPVTTPTPAASAPSPAPNAPASAPSAGERGIGFVTPLVLMLVLTAAVWAGSRRWRMLRERGRYNPSVLGASVEQPGPIDAPPSFQHTGADMMIDRIEPADGESDPDFVRAVFAA